MKLRQTKYRAFHKVDGFKYYGDLMVFQLMNGDWKLDDMTEDVCLAKECGYTFTECIGITDVKGKDIYEGDLVKVKSFKSKDEVYDQTNELLSKSKMIFRIEWNDYYCAFVGINTEDDSHNLILGNYEFEVVGNIFIDKK